MGTGARGLDEQFFMHRQPSASKTPPPSLCTSSSTEGCLFFKNASSSSLLAEPGAAVSSFYGVRMIRMIKLIFFQCVTHLTPHRRRQLLKSCVRRVARMNCTGYSEGRILRKKKK